MNADCSEEYPVRAEHDNLEKILAAMLQMEPSCRDHFRANQVRKYTEQDRILAAMLQMKLSCRDQFSANQVRKYRYTEQDRILAAMLQIKSPLAEIILENFA